MAGNSFGTLFRFTTWGESHGPAIGCVVDGVPPRLPLAEADIQPWLDRRKPGQSRFTTQRREKRPGQDPVRRVRGRDHRHADPAADRQRATSAPRITTHIARPVPPRPCRLHLLEEIRHPRLSRRRPRLGARDRVARRRRRRRAQDPGRRASTIRGALVQIGPHAIDRARWDWRAVEDNPFWCPDAADGAALGRLSRRRAQGRLVGRRGDRGRRERRAGRARRADLRQARRRSRRAR